MKYGLLGTKQQSVTVVIVPIN